MLQASSPAQTHRKTQTESFLGEQLQFRFPKPLIPLQQLHYNSQPEQTTVELELDNSSSDSDLNSTSKDTTNSSLYDFTNSTTNLKFPSFQKISFVSEDSFTFNSAKSHPTVTSITSVSDNESDNESDNDNQSMSSSVYINTTYANNSKMRQNSNIQPQFKVTKVSSSACEIPLPTRDTSSAYRGLGLGLTNSNTGDVSVTSAAAVKSVSLNSHRKAKSMSSSYGSVTYSNPYNAHSSMSSRINKPLPQKEAPLPNIPRSPQQERPYGAAPVPSRRVSSTATTDVFLNNTGTVRRRSYRNSSDLGVRRTSFREAIENINNNTIFQESPTSPVTHNPFTNNSRVNGGSHSISPYDSSLDSLSDLPLVDLEAPLKKRSSDEVVIGYDDHISLNSELLFREPSIVIPFDENVSRSGTLRRKLTSASKSLKKLAAEQKQQLEEEREHQSSPLNPSKSKLLKSRKSKRQVKQVKQVKQAKQAKQVKQSISNPDLKRSNATRRKQGWLSNLAIFFKTARKTINRRWRHLTTRNKKKDFKRKYRKDIVISAPFNAQHITNTDPNAPLADIMNPSQPAPPTKEKAIRLASDSAAAIGKKKSSKSMNSMKSIRRLSKFRNVKPIIPEQENNVDPETLIRFLSAEPDDERDVQLERALSAEQNTPKLAQYQIQASRKSSKQSLKDVHRPSLRKVSVDSNDSALMKKLSAKAESPLYQKSAVIGEDIEEGDVLQRSSTFAAPVNSSVVEPIKRSTTFAASKKPTSADQERSNQLKRLLSLSKRSISQPLEESQQEQESYAGPNDDIYGIASDKTSPQQQRSQVDQYGYPPQTRDMVSVWSHYLKMVINNRIEMKLEIDENLASLYDAAGAEKRKSIGDDDGKHSKRESIFDSILSDYTADSLSDYSDEGDNDTSPSDEKQSSASSMSDFDVKFISRQKSILKDYGERKTTAASSTTFIPGAISNKTLTPSMSSAQSTENSVAAAAPPPPPLHPLNPSKSVNRMSMDDKHLNSIYENKLLPTSPAQINVNKRLSLPAVSPNQLQSFAESTSANQSRRHSYIAGGIANRDSIFSDNNNLVVLSVENTRNSSNSNAHSSSPLKQEVRQSTVAPNSKYNQLMNTFYNKDNSENKIISPTPIRAISGDSVPGSSRKASTATTMSFEVGDDQEDREVRAFSYQQSMINEDDESYDEQDDIAEHLLKNYSQHKLKDYNSSSSVVLSDAAIKRQPTKQFAESSVNERTVNSSPVPIGKKRAGMFKHFFKNAVTAN